MKSLLSKVILLLSLCNIGVSLQAQDVFGKPEEIFFGLKGDIYAIPENTHKLPPFEGLTKIGEIYTNKLNIPKTYFDNGFPGVSNRFEWFAIDYNGYFWIDTSGTYIFKLSSDDGSMLVIDEKVVIDNSNGGAIHTKLNEVKLNRGMHKINVKYFQGPRYHVALMLEVYKANNIWDFFDMQDFSIVKIKKEKDALRLIMDNDILFDFDEYRINNDNALYTLSEIKHFFLDRIEYKKIIIEGHTDNIGTEEYNQLLSERRASSVKNWFYDNGVDPRKISIIGYGENKPAYPNTPEKRYLNRRIEIIISY